MPRQHAPTPHQAGGIVDVPLRVLRISHHDADLGHCLGQVLECPADLPPHAAMEQQILGRIAGQREFGKQHQVGPQLIARAPRLADHALEIAADVADQQIDLRQRQLQSIGRHQLSINDLSNDP